jgi:ureidoglycolate lyase
MIGARVRSFNKNRDDLRAVGTLNSNSYLKRKTSFISLFQFLNFNLDIFISQPPKMTHRRLVIEPLTVEAFAPFGSVLQNPASYGAATKGVIANQGTATKYPDINLVENYYHLALSKKPSRVSMSMFVCKPRRLRHQGVESLLDVNILERHPFTTQTFVPLGLGGSKNVESQYLVVVAPTLAGVSDSRRDSLTRPKPYPTRGTQGSEGATSKVYSRARPSPFDNDKTPPSFNRAPGTRAKLPKGVGLPDICKLRVFLARGDQAVTYGAGTWHAPMLVIGRKEVEFVVTQFVNGVAIEDCQEMEVDGGSIDLKPIEDSLAKAKL